MRGTIRTLHAVQWTMLGSIFLYAVVGEVLGSGATAVNPSLSYVFSTASVAIVGIIRGKAHTGVVFRGKPGVSSR